MFTFVKSSCSLKLACSRFRALSKISMVFNEIQELFYAMDDKKAAAVHFQCFRVEPGRAPATYESALCCSCKLHRDFAMRS